MDEYLEQLVSGERGGWRRAALALSWALIAALAVAAMIFAAGIIGPGAERIEIRWLNLALTVACLALAWLIYRRKDALVCDYDYILRGGVLEVWAILNRRRRVRRAEIALERAAAAGPARGSGFAAEAKRPGLARHDWRGRGEDLYYVCYADARGQRHMALLELNEEMAAAVRANRSLARGAWRE